MRGASFALVVLAMLPTSCSVSTLATSDSGGAPDAGAPVVVAPPAPASLPVGVAVPPCDAAVFARPPDVVVTPAVLGDCTALLFPIDVADLAVERPTSPFDLLPSCWRVVEADAASGWTPGETFSTDRWASALLRGGTRTVTLEARGFAIDGTSYGGRVTPSWPAFPEPTFDVPGRVVALAGRSDWGVNGLLVATETRVLRIGGTGRDTWDLPPGAVPALNAQLDPVPGWVYSDGTALHAVMQSWDGAHDVPLPGLDPLGPVVTWAGDDGCGPTMAVASGARLAFVASPLPCTPTVMPPGLVSVVALAAPANDIVPRGDPAAWLAVREGNALEAVDPRAGRASPLGVGGPVRALVTGSSESFALRVDGRAVCLFVSCWQGSPSYATADLDALGTPLSLQERVLLGTDGVAASLDAGVVGPTFLAGHLTAVSTAPFAPYATYDAVADVSHVVEPRRRSCPP